MTMKIRTAIGIVFLTLLSSASARAQWNDVRSIFFDTIITGYAEPTPVGVDAMTYVGLTPITADDTTFMQYATTIVQRDVDFYADFELVPIDSFYLRTYELSELNLLGWRRLGASYVVKLEAEFPGTNMRVRWRLFDTYKQQQVNRGQFEYHRNFWRVIAHDIANQIVRTLTGEEGPFRTKVAFVRKLNGAKEVFMSDYDGANEVQLTNNGTINLSPTFSTDGESIFFTSYLDGNPQLYRLDIATREVTPLNKHKGLVVAPAVSPDGNKIACVLTRDGNAEIYVLDLDGRIIKRLTRTPAIESAPTWSPDGDLIAFSSDRTGSPQLYVMDADGFNVTRVTWDGSYNDSPVWARRGDRLVFVSRTNRGRFDVAAINTDGSEYRVLTYLGMNENPHFSPDGKHIIFSSSRLSEGDIYTMDVTGRNQRRLTRQGDASNPAWGPIK